MVTITDMVVKVAMNVFSGNFGAKVQATYVQENRKGVLGTIAGAEQPVTIIITEAYTNAWQSTMVDQNSDILVYGEAGSVLASKTCVGGVLKIGERKLRIESFAVATNQRTGEVAHIELGCSEL